MIRVLQIPGSLETGGLQTVAMNWARYTDRARIQYDFLVYGDKVGDYEQEALDLGCRVFHMARSEDPLRFYHDLKQLISENGPYDVVYSHTFFSSGIVLRAAKKCGVKTCIAHAHSGERGSDKKLLRKMFYRWMRSWLGRYADVKLACSEDAGKYVYGVDSGFTVINNGIDAKRYVFDPEARKRIRSAFGIGDEFVLGNVGRFSSGKNHLFMIEVFGELLRTVPRSKLLLVGDGELRSAAEKQADELGLGGQVIFAGKRTDVPQMLSAMDVFIFPSFFEGLGIVGIEAQAAGLPTVCSDSIPHAVKATDLVMFKPLSAGAAQWAETIAKYANGYERKDMSGQIADSGYDLCQSAKRMEAILTGACEQGEVKHK